MQPALKATRPGLFVTGTDTGVGKTRIATQVASLLTQAGRRVGVLKPLASGAVRRAGSLVSEDAAALRQAVGWDVPEPWITPLAFEEPLAPSVAARRAGTPLRFDRLVGAITEAMRSWSPDPDLWIVEGVGGFLCPIADDATVADLARAFDFPILIVARRGLGTINHTLLTLRSVRHLGLRVAGVILNEAEPGDDPLAAESNADELLRWLDDVPILAETRFAPASVDDQAWAHSLAPIDWEGRAALPRIASPG